MTTAGSTRGWARWCCDACAEACASEVRLLGRLLGDDEGEATCAACGAVGPAPHALTDGQVSRARANRGRDDYHAVRDGRHWTCRGCGQPCFACADAAAVCAGEGCGVLADGPADARGGLR